MKRVLELENEIDEKNFSIESKEKEIEALTELLKVRMRLLLIGYWLDLPENSPFLYFSIGLQRFPYLWMC